MTSMQTLQNAKRRDLLGKTISIQNDVWKIDGVGFTVDGKVYLALASTTRFRQQKNGKNPVSIADWFPIEEIEALI
jgi:hypothetical protein